MVDFHTHILPDMDDGAKTFEESEAMIMSLISQGVDTILLTSHFYFETTIDEYIKMRDEKLNKLKKSLENINVKLIPACEVHLTKNIEIDELYKLKIGDTNYILIELPAEKTFSFATYEKLENIIDYLGLTPIIAHIERYPFIYKTPGIVSVLNSLGCVLQLNTSSLFRPLLKNMSYALIKKQQVQLLGSDCHNITTRPPIFDAAIQKIRHRFGEGYVNELIKTSYDVLKDKKIDSPPYNPIKKLFKFYI